MVAEFVKIAYAVTVPVLLTASMFTASRYGRTALNIMAVSNLLLIINSWFLGKQLYGFYELAQSLNLQPPKDIEPDYRLALDVYGVLLLPLLSCFRVIRNSRLFTLVLLLLLYDFYKPASWYLYDMSAKVIMYVCLLCIGYATLWLLNHLPHQQHPRK